LKKSGAVRELGKTLTGETSVALKRKGVETMHKGHIVSKFRCQIAESKMLHARPPETEKLGPEKRKNIRGEKKNQGEERRGCAPTVRVPKKV